MKRRSRTSRFSYGIRYAATVIIYKKKIKNITNIEMFDSHHPTADPKNYLEYTVGGAECPFTTFYSIN